LRAIVSAILALLSFQHSVCGISYNVAGLENTYVRVYLIVRIVS